MAATLSNLTLLSKAAAKQVSLSGVSWAWFDGDVGALVAPTDKGTSETTDANGVMALSMPNSTLTSGQFGTLLLYDSTGSKVGAYRLAVD